MNIHQLLNRLENNEISIDKCGHKFRESAAIEELIRALKFHRDYNTERKDSTDYSRECFREMNLDDAYGPDQHYMDGFESQIYCPMCGKRGMRLRFKDNDTLHVVVWNDRGNPYTCDTKDGSHKTFIDVKSGLLKFANYFDVPEAPKDEEYSEKYNICTLKGRRNIADFLAESNYGYGQMGNMSVEIYRSKDKKSIKILRGFAFDFINEEIFYHEEEGNEIPEYLLKLKKESDDFIADYELMGSISLSVWRWMCIDPEFLSDDVTISSENIESFDVVPGKWEIVHHYDCDYNDENMAVSELKLVE